MLEGVEPSWLSILPAAVTIVLAFATRQVILALFAGVVCGGLVLAARTGDWEDLNIVSRFLLPAIGSASFAQILIIYLWCLGGLVGMWGATGGARHFAETVGGKIARGPKSALFFGWLVGVLFHQGGTVSTVLAGTTVKPVTDRYRVSHEELSYVVDSTASPIATLIPFNAWPLYVAGLVAGTIPLIPTEQRAYEFFIGSIPYNFYALLAVLSTLLFALGWLPWIGARMQRARIRSRETGALDAPEAEPMLASEAPASSDAVGGAPAYSPSLADFVVPIGVLLSIAIVLLVCDLMINQGEGLVGALRYGVFQAAAIMTGTGYATADFDAWPHFARALLFLLMFVGGCAGSTSGSIKVARWIIVLRKMVADLKRILRPHAVIPVRLGQRAIPEAVVTSVTTFLIMFLSLFALGGLTLSLMGHDMITAFSASAACLGNVGPGFGLVGPTQNYAFFEWPAKLVLMAMMVIGRLELYTILVMLFVRPRRWRR